MGYAGGSGNVFSQSVNMKDIESGFRSIETLGFPEIPSC